VDAGRPDPRRRRDHRGKLTVDPAITDYTVEVRTMTGAKMGEPFTLAPTSGTGDLPADQTVPKLTATPGATGTETAPVEASSVTLASESAADVYFTTDGSKVVEGDLPSDAAQLYKAPIAISKLTEVRGVAIDRAGNVSEVVAGFYAPPAAAQPGALAAPVLTDPRAPTSARPRSS
jgi:hypothetical protein